MSSKLRRLVGDREELPLRELLETLLGPEGRRRLKLRHIANTELFNLYDSDLVWRLHNAKNLSDQEYWQSDESLSGAIDAYLSTSEKVKGYNPKT